MAKKTTRIDGRTPNELREITITRNFTRYAPGSVMIAAGGTQVLCTAMAEQSIPPFLEGTGTGWVTAEYDMLPSSTHSRRRRDIQRGSRDGRSQEIQRFIGRALRTVVRRELLGERTIYIDCDVIQADGGTRTLAVTGAYLAFHDAVEKLRAAGQITGQPIISEVAAVSVGIVRGTPMLDLCYEEDSKAEVDMNVVMTGAGGIIEIQGTAEREPFSRAQFDQLFKLASSGIEKLVKIQRQAIREK